MNPFDKIVELLRELPGIGPRQARRFAYFFLSKDIAYLQELSKTLLLVKESFSQCNSCLRFFKKTGKPTCPTCLDDSRTKNELMLVAKDIDFENIEKSGAYQGYYFILGNLLPLTAKDASKNPRIDILKKKLANQGKVKELVFALSATVEGDHTEEILSHELKDIASEKGIKFLKLGKGLSTGVELEYADKDTIAGALKNKTAAF